MKKREAKSKGERERYSHLNSEFQRITRRDKKAFLEENNRMVMTRDHFKKIRDAKGTFHEKIDTIKDRNGMNITEEDIKKRYKNTLNNYTKKIFMTHIVMVV